MVDVVDGTAGVVGAGLVVGAEARWLLEQPAARRAAATTAARAARLLVGMVGN